MSNKDKYVKVFKSVFDTNKIKLGEEFTFKNVDEWDSMAHLTLISELENEFDVMFESEDILHFGGFINGMKILSKYGILFDD